MKKRGFTLAEVLITLGIIGFIATITVSSLKTDTNARVNDTSIKVAKSDLEKVFATMMIDDEVPTLSETKFWLNAGSRENTLKKYIKNVGIENKFAGDNTCFEIKSGAQFGINFEDTNDDEDDGWVGGITFDANGDKAPNSMRTKDNPNGDRVYAHITDDGLIEFVEEE